MNSAPFIRYPVLQIRPQALLVYERTEWFLSKRKKEPSAKRHSVQGETTYTGLINDSSRRRLKRAIQLLLAIAKPKQRLNPTTNKWYNFKINFITLTLPAPQGSISDKELKAKVLDIWIKKARRRFKLNSYVWRAERQVNGNLHFHFVTDTFIPYDQLRDTWNDSVEKVGLLTAFEKKHGHRFPNSTDVHAIKHVRNLANYICKYVSKGQTTAKDLQPQPPWTKPTTAFKPQKNPPKFKRLLTLDEQRINGKVWDCTTNLKAKKNCEFILETEASELWEEASTKYPDSKINKELFSMIYFMPGVLQRMLKGPVKAGYDSWIETISKPKPRKRRVKRLPIFDIAKPNKSQRRSKAN